jgi:hypothetical protein
MNQVGKVVLAALGVLGGASSTAIAADAVQDFSNSANPNGPWSFGWAAVLGGAFNLYTNHNVNHFVSGLDDWWLGSCGDVSPAVTHNTTGSPVDSGTVTIPPDVLNLHPGCAGQYSIVRWTAPAAGPYQIQGRFQGNDHNPTTTDVHIRLNSSTTLFDNEVSTYGIGTAIPFSLARQLNAGDTIDFTVGYGTDGRFDYDSTGLAATITPIPCVVPPSGMVSWWAGDGNALDIQGANNGIMAGGAAFGSGEVGQAFSLTNSGYVDVPESVTLQLASAITIDAWVYRNALDNTFQTIVKKADISHGYSLELEDGTGRVIFFIFSHNSGAYGWVRATSTTVLQANTWYHIAGTFDGSLLRIYVNATLENTGTPFSNTIDWAYGDLNIGTDPSNLGDPRRYWNGLIDEVEIFNRALSDAEIASLYNAGSAGKCKPSALSVSPVSYTYGGNATLQATLIRTSDNTAVSGETVSFTLNGNAAGSTVTDASGIATKNLTGVTSVNAGTYPTGAGANFAGDGSLAASSGTANLSVAQASQTITFAALTDKTFGDPDISVSATASSALTVTFVVGATDNCTISGTTVHITGAGSCTVTAQQAGDTNFSAASDLPRSFSIHMATQATVTVIASTDATYGAAGANATAGGGSGTGAYSYSAGSSSACSIDSATGAITVTHGTGTCSITAARAGDANYSASATSAPAAVTIHKATQTITFNPLANVKLSQSPVTVSATAALGLTVTFTTTTPPVCTPGGTNGATITLIATGTCTVVAHQAGDTNYSAATDVPQSFTVGNGKADQTITFGVLADKTLAQSPVTVSATASSNLAVTFTTTTPAVCTAGGKSGATISLVAAGTCTVQAAQAGGPSYNPAPSVTRSFTVTKADQTILFTTLTDKKLALSPVTVSATASSGLAVTFTTTTPAKCTASGKNGATIKLVATGPCTVKADQIGNATYNAAPSVSQSFNVMP